MTDDKTRCAAVHFATGQRCELENGHPPTSGHQNGIHLWFDPMPRRQRKRGKR